MAEPAPTRQRLLVEGMRLFAERGFRATAVGDIEAAAGLQPRRGALYKHYASKQALLDAAVRDHLDRAAAGATQISEVHRTFAPRNERSQLWPIVWGLGRWFLEEMDRLKDLTRVLEHEGQRMVDLTIEIKHDIVDLSYRTAADLIAAIAPDTHDPAATAVLVLGPLVALRRTAWTFGAPPLDIDDDRALEAWTELTLTMLDASGDDDRP
ncbi:MAG: TetR/AcrR family transcriptional regulator [Actinomycetota bacterium]|nr:TetR/AcrR family transcriptional regulator [Actinomycetota bacterium]